MSCTRSNAILLTSLGEDSGLDNELLRTGEILKEEFLDPLGLSQREFARSIDVPANRINDIVRGKRSITGDTAIRFSLALGTSPEMWLRLQARYELEKAQDESDPGLRRKIKPVVPA